MKKILFILVSLAVVLTGCNKEGGYDALVSDLGFLENAEAVKFNVTYGDLESLSISYVIDTDEDITYMDAGVFTGYFARGYGYSNVGNFWYATELDRDELGDIEGMVSYTDILTNLPEGTKSLSEIGDLDLEDYGFEQGVTLNELVISKGDNKYTIKGLENEVTIDTSNGLELIFDTDDSATVTIKVTAESSLEVPKEALDAEGKDAGDLFDFLD